jgi:hypothetical protein
VLQQATKALALQAYPFFCALHRTLLPHSRALASQYFALLKQWHTGALTEAEAAPADSGSARA